MSAVLETQLRPAGTATRVRVCHVSLTLHTGGLERLLADLARYHDRDRYELEFVAIREIGRFAEEIRATGCPVHLLKSGNRWGHVRQLRSLFRERRVDVVHTHNTYPHLYGTLAARLAGIPVVVQTRHGQRTGHGWKSSLQYRTAAWGVDRIIGVSDDAARLTVSQDGVPARKVGRIWNGIDLSQFHYQGPVAAPVGISVGRLSPEKDFPTLLKAVAIVGRQWPEFRLRLVGGGPQQTLLDELATSLGIADRVEFLGERKDVPAQLGQAAFYISSSLSEGISLTLLEAMATGLPVVATAVGGNSEIVLPGVTGQLCPAGDPESLAKTILAMRDVRSEWTAMGAAGRERVRQEFEITRMARDYERLYDDLLDARGRSRVPRSRD